MNNQINICVVRDDMHINTEEIFTYKLNAHQQ